MIHWPAIIKLSGVDELIFIPTHASLQTHAHLRDIRFHHDDHLYDSAGQEFLINPMKPEEPIPTGRHITLEKAVQLVRLHATQDGACCIAKLNANSIADAIALVA